MASRKESLCHPPQHLLIMALRSVSLTLQAKKLRDKGRCVGPRRYTTPEPEGDHATASGSPGRPCSPALSPFAKQALRKTTVQRSRVKLPGRQRIPCASAPSQDRGTRRALPAVRTKAVPPCCWQAARRKEERARETEEQAKEKEKGEKERRGKGGRATVPLRGQSGFSMETKVPVCLKMSLKRKIVNHFPPRRQERWPGLDSCIGKTFLSITWVQAPTYARCYGAYF